jgi:uncharacterized protein (DUF934 family)
MTDPTPRLWTPEGFRPDAWTHAGSAEALAGAGSVILPLAAYLELEAGERKGARARLGVQLAPAEGVEALEPYLADLPLVALAFPNFSDGRSFSKAELLRSRLGYRGILRATGQVLVDQLPHMLRLGFNQFEVSNPVLLRRLEEGHIGGLPLAYQPTAEKAPEPVPALGQGYSWRRVPKR